MNAPSALLKASSLKDEILLPMKRAFVGKDEIIDLLAVALVGGENLFLMGSPGTAKSALVRDLASRIQGRSFDYLLTRFTEPNELFGPFDIRKLREGELVTNKEGMLPEAEIVFLDELLNANSAVLNSLLMVLNERVFRRGRETIKVPMLLAVGASNCLPQEQALKALFDRFLLRVTCENVPQEKLQEVIDAGWNLERQSGQDRAMSHFRIDDIRELQEFIKHVDVAQVRPQYVELINRLRHVGVAVSDRRAVKFQRLMAASAVICGRTQANASDMWLLRYTWETEEQQEILATLVNEAIERAAGDGLESPHPRSKAGTSPDPDALALDLDRIGHRLGRPVSSADRSYLQDQLSVLSGRCDWVENSQAKEFLKQRVQDLWTSIESLDAQSVGSE